MSEIQKPQPQELKPLRRALERDINSLERSIASGNKVYALESEYKIPLKDGSFLDIFALCSNEGGGLESNGRKHLIVWAKLGDQVVCRRGVAMRYNGNYFSASGAYIETDEDLRGKGIAGAVERFHSQAMQGIADTSGKEIAEEVENANVEKLEEAFRRPDKYTPDQVAQFEAEQEAWRKLFSRENGYISNTKIYQPRPESANTVKFKEADIDTVKNLFSN